MERIWINWKDNCRKALSSVVAFLLVLVMYDVLVILLMNPSQKCWS